jgi:hypothetical protein
MGSVQKRADPVLVQDQPWEFRLDNGCKHIFTVSACYDTISLTARICLSIDPNVIRTPGDPNGEWRIWYHSHISGHNFVNTSGSHRTSGWLTANSSDGIAWEKPALGLYDIGTGSPQCKTNPELCQIGKANNIINTFAGAGVMRDTSPMLVNASEQFKAFSGDADANTHVSPDGLHWKPAPLHPRISFQPLPRGHQAYDCHNNLVWDWRTSTYLMTTRWDNNDGRCVMNFRSKESEFGGWPTTVAPVDLVLNGSSAHQLYSQITFPFYNVYLGLVMTFDTINASKVGTIECRLAMGRLGKQWHFIGWDPASSAHTNSSQFIPRGNLSPLGSHDFDSHIIFAAAHPVPMDAQEGVRLYYMVSSAPLKYNSQSL